MLPAVALLAAPALSAAQVPAWGGNSASRYSYSRLTPAQAESLRRFETQSAEALAIESARLLDGAVDPELYRVGPGDSFALIAGGQTRITIEVPVGPEGSAVLPEGAPVPLDGLTLAQAKRALVEASKRVWRSGQVEVMLSRVRAFKAHIGGEVMLPGTYAVSASTRASELVERAGGLAEGASQRDLTVRHRDGTGDPVDLLLFTRTGLSLANPYLRDGDMLLVPPRREPAVLAGEVYYPGNYEALPGERLPRLLQVAGGLTPAAIRDSIVIVRFGEDGAQSAEVVAEGDDVPVQAGDRVLVRRIPGWHLDERVIVDGEVRFPGVYTMPPGGEPLSEVIQRAGGFTPRASLATAVVLRARPSEAGFDQRTQKIQSSPLTLLSDGELEYYRMRGLTDRVPLSVDFQKLGEDGQDLRLRDGDRVIVPFTRGTVRVLGEVKQPGHVAYRPGDEWKDYVEASGGFTKRADKGRVRVARGELGAFVPASDAGSISEDFVIWVPEETPTPRWQTVREAVTVLSQLATIYLIYDTVRNR